jgi:hypothetical protein
MAYSKTLNGVNSGFFDLDRYRRFTMNMTQIFLMTVALVVLSAGCASDGSSLKNPRHQRPQSHKLSVATPLRYAAIAQQLERFNGAITEEIEMETGISQTSIDDASI